MSARLAMNSASAAFRMMPTTMQEQLQTFVATLAASRGASANTQGAYRTDLRQLLDFLSRRGLVRWDGVTEQHLDDFLAHLAEREYAPTSVARKVAAIRSFFVFLEADGVVARSPAHSLRSPRVARFIPPTVSPAVAARLFGQPRTTTPMGLRDAAMLALLQTTGMRVSEIVSLNLDDLGPAFASVRCHGRAGRERELPLPDATQAAIRAYLERGRPAHVGGDASAALFLNHHGARLTRQGFWLIMKARARAVGIEDISPHSLRHAFALELIEQGLELRTVQARLGHANLATTLVYRQAYDARIEQSITVEYSATDDTGEYVTAVTNPREPAACEGGHR